MRRILWFTGVILFLIIVLLSVHFSTTNEEFSRYNIQWNGSSRFADRFEEAGGDTIGDLDRLNTGNVTLLLIIAPYRTSTAAEIREYRRFLDRGGTIFLADDFGTGNELLSGLGSGIQILPGNLSSVTRLYDDPSSVVTTPVRNDTVLMNVSSLVLNRPAALDGGEALVTTSLLSWIDRNGDGLPGTDEDLGRFTVLSREGAGAGTLYVLSDPSIFTNTMEQPEKGDNPVFISNLLHEAGMPALDQVQGRTGTDDILIVSMQAMQQSVYARLIIVSILIGIVAYLFRRGDDR